MAVSLKPEVILGSEHLGLTNSLITALVISILLVIFFAIYTSKITVNPRSRFQLLLESAVTSLHGLAVGIMGKKKAKAYFPFIFTFFTFIIVSNWFGLLPFVGSIGLAHHPHEASKIAVPIAVIGEDGLHITKEEEIHAPFFRAPSADLNFTFALATISFLLIEFISLKELGFGHLAKFFDYRVKVGTGWKIILTPLTFLANFASKTLELILEFSRIISFSFRLFGNIFAGEILLLVVTSLTFGVFTFPFIGLELFVGFVQALVFVFLTMVFIRVSSEAHH